MAEWIGRELERLRKLRGLRREDVAAQLTEPVSPSTIRNIEHDESYNVSLALLRQIAAVLGARINVACESLDAPVTEDETQSTTRLIDNEYFISYIRSKYPECPLTNSQIGRRMWDFAKPRGAEMMNGRKQMKKLPATTTGANYRLPSHAAEYRVRESDLDLLHSFADRLGRAFRDEKGRVLVPVGPVIRQEQL
ncbi:MAG: helix-turn-helix domain-containing protein [Gemmatimonadaceae bacterium]|nr:helix-turn-helix domain-containing protein [Gemmatimonadaceae bacterium]